MKISNTNRSIKQTEKVENSFGEMVQGYKVVVI